uniref:Uncharacterized protein n=1 Tax=Salix viminalis TaxID=40686 RepID=A0A6N2L751_SALVM
MFELEIEITWMMLQGKVSDARYVSAPVCSDENVSSMFKSVRINEINMLELYLNRRRKQEALIVLKDS